ncbi:17850_t:CDS:1, partial [Racocetra persica]
INSNNELLFNQENNSNLEIISDRKFKELSETLTDNEFEIDNELDKLLKSKNIQILEIYIRLIFET